MASLVLSVVYATDQRRKHRLHTHHLSLSSVRAGVLGLQRVGDAGVNAVLLGQALAFATPGKSNVGGVRWLRIATRFAHHRLLGKYLTMSNSSSTVTGKGVA
jgi:hypothetical protein